MEKRLVKLRLDEIVPYENNPRKNKKAVGIVAESIEQTGYNNPIIVDENRVILAGHTRRLALMKTGETEAEVLQIFGMSEDQKKKYRLLDNKAGEFSSWDYVILTEELAGLEWDGLNLDWGLDKDVEDVEVGEKKKGHKCPECGFEW